MEIQQIKSKVLDYILQNNIDLKDKRKVQNIFEGYSCLNAIQETKGKDYSIIFNDQQNLNAFEIRSKDSNYYKIFQIDKNFQEIDLTTPLDIDKFIMDKKKHYLSELDNELEQVNQNKEAIINNKIIYQQVQNNSSNTFQDKFAKPDDLGIQRPYIQYDRLYPPNQFDQKEVFPEHDPNQIFRNPQNRTGPLSRQGKSNDFFGNPNAFFK